jgi:hypothetical protein
MAWGSAEWSRQHQMLGSGPTAGLDRAVAEGGAAIGGAGRSADRDQASRRGRCLWRLQ